MMLALAKATSQTAEALPPGVRWLDVSSAARLLKCSDRAIRLRIENEWDRGGLAMKRSSPRGGRPCWYVRSDAHPRLAVCRLPQHIPASVNQLSEKQRRQLAKRKQILDGWESAIAQASRDGGSIAAATAIYLSLVKDEAREQLSDDTLRGWRKRYRREGINGLIDGRWLQSAARSESHHEFYSALIHWMRNKAKLKVQVAYELARQQAMDNEWTFPQIHTARRYLKSLPESVTSRRNGDEAEQMEINGHVERDYTTLRSNQVWCGDSHQFDVIVSHNGKLLRPWLTAFEDLRSRKIVGYVIDALDANEDTVIATFRSGCIAHGVPAAVYIDCGKNWDSYALQGMTKTVRRKEGLMRQAADPKNPGGIFGQLGVRVIHALPYNAKAKPIERFFGTVCERFSKLFSTYCGNTPDAKPDDLAKRLSGQNVPTLQELADDFATWLETDYHQRVHTGDGMDGHTPAEAFNLHLEFKRVATDEELDLLLQKISQPVKVGRNGVTYKGRRYFGDALLAMTGKNVRLRSDANDISRITVWSEDEKFICEATATKPMPFMPSEQEWRRAGAMTTRRKKLAREYHDVRPVIHEDQRDLLFQGRAEENRRRQAEQPPAVDPPPVPIKPLRSKVIDQMRALKDAAAADRARALAGDADSLRLDAVAGLFRSAPAPADQSESSIDFSEVGKLLREQA